MARNRNGNFTRGYQSTRRTLQQLHELGENVIIAAKTALKEGAGLIVDDARSRVPVATGKLKISIGAISKRDGAEYNISADAKNEYGIPYSQFVEFDPRINKPFLYPSLETNAGTVRRKIIDSIRNAIGGGG